MIPIRRSTTLTLFATGRASARQRDTEPRCGADLNLKYREDKTLEQPSAR
ncbi:Uncharacterised protein [Mycobacterium tuberculosis]|nr:Uncharacterised protein [Mycobacterium tuberculosis]